MVESMRMLREVSGCALVDAKATMLHVTRTPRVCHRCSHGLDGIGITVCSRCRSLNFDWPE
jgi:hypothetical protein